MGMQSSRSLDGMAGKSRLARGNACCISEKFWLGNLRVSSHAPKQRLAFLTFFERGVYIRLPLPSSKLQARRAVCGRTPGYAIESAGDTGSKPVGNGFFSLWRRRGVAKRALPLPAFRRRPPVIGSFLSHAIDHEARALLAVAQRLAVEGVERNMGDDLR